jgi:hypothetical protein
MEERVFAGIENFALGTSMRQDLPHSGQVLL